MASRSARVSCSRRRTSARSRGSEGGKVEGARSCKKSVMEIVPVVESDGVDAAHILDGPEGACHGKEWIAGRESEQHVIESQGRSTAADLANQFLCRGNTVRPEVRDVRMLEARVHRRQP